MGECDDAFGDVGAAARGKGERGRGLGNGVLRMVAFERGLAWSVWRVFDKGIALRVESGGEEHGAEGNTGAVLIIKF